MKAKVILTSTAVLGMLTACSQDELAIIEANAPAEVAARPMAGKAVIKFGDETRFVKETGQFTKGDKIGLYLMDMFVGNITGAEELNANKTEWWKKSVWQAMYLPTNQIHTNYLYEMNKTQTAFENKGNNALTEGNYFLFYDPECTNNDKAYRNRRELWKALSSTIDLSEEGSDYTNNPTYNPETQDGKWAGLYANLGNQFYLDYTQIYRDADAVNADGELVINAKLKAVLDQYQINLINESAHKYHIKEIRIYPEAGIPVPNIAYVKPSPISGNDLYSVIDPAYKGDAYPVGEEFTEIEQKNAFTQAMARALVTYGQAGQPGSPIPYGYEGETETAPYYTVKFPESAIIDVHSGPITLQDGIEAIFSAPNLGKAKFVVYADQYDPFVKNEDGTKGVWVPGYFTEGADHASWYLEDCIDEANIGRLSFDDYAFTKYNTIAKVQTTQDLKDKVKATLSKGWVAEIQAELDGDGIAIDNELETLINDYETLYGKQVVLTIKPKGHDIAIVDNDLLTSNNFNLGNYTGAAAIVLKADQKLAATMVGKTIKVPADQTINLDLNGQRLGKVQNAGIINVTGEGVLNAVNNGEVNVAAGANMQSHSFVNNGTLNVEGIVREYTENPSTITNDGTVNVGDNAQVTITDGAGTLNVSKVTVKGGTQNHIEVVDPANTTVVYETTLGNLQEIEKNLKAILPAHFFTDPDMAIKVTSSASKVEKAMTATIAAMIDIEFTEAVTVDPVDPTTLDLSVMKSVKFNGLTVKKDKTLKTNNVIVSNNVIVEAGATLEDAATINVADATIILYENAKLKAAGVDGTGTIFGYDTQIVDASDAKLSPASGVVVKGHL